MYGLGQAIDRGHCEASIGDTRITDRDFADNAIIFADSLALDALHEDAMPLRL